MVDAIIVMSVKFRLAAKGADPQRVMEMISRRLHPKDQIRWTKFIVLLNLYP